MKKNRPSTTHFLIISFALLIPVLIHAQESHTCKDHKQYAPLWRMAQPEARSAANAGISDSINLLKHTLFIDLTDFSGFESSSACSIEFEALVDGIANLPLDLKGQEVDSVVHNSGQLDFTHVGELLNIQLPAAMNSGSADMVTVHYRGGNVVDPSGFGGFYFNSNIAYNIGVAFTDWPASYGRVWFPCFDNFVEKSIFEFQILTPPNRAAYSNGYLQQTDTTSNGNLLFHWVMDYPIPSYLASVAVAEYEQATFAFPSITGDTIPVYLVGGSNNVNNMVNAFQNLQTVFDGFEEHFGHYRWPRIGYNYTPVGAMEHSTNISFPQSLTGGDLAQSVMAHELAHEWFGNLVTCRTPADMWLNEGWAEFLSIFAYEIIEGQESYTDRIRGNLRKILQNAHFHDGGFLTMNQIPPEHTYGEHAYYKGAAMAHSLRGYLGDSLFFDAMRDYLNEFAFKNASSEDLRDFLNSLPGTNVTNFFDDWIFQPGWAQFSVDEMEVSGGGGLYTVDVTIQQRLRAANNFYQEVPITLSLMDDEWNIHEQTVVVSGETTTLSVSCPFAPIYATLNRDLKLNYGVTAWEGDISSTGLLVMNDAFANLLVQEAPGTSTLRIEHNWTGPGGAVEGDAYIVSPDRYWRVGGIPDPGFVTNMRMDFDGRNGANSFLDVELFALPGDGFDENDIVVLHRAQPTDAWTLWNDITLNTLGSPTNGHARITVENLTLGEYTFGLPNPNVSAGFNERNKIRVFPNPTTERLVIDMGDWNESGNLSAVLTDMNGRRVFSNSIQAGETTLWIPQHVARGTYILEVTDGQRVLHSSQVVLR